VSFLVLSGCAGSDIVYDYPVRDPKNPGNITTDKELEAREKITGKLFGDSLENLFDGGPKKDAPAGSSIGVNAFLWRATLDTISFMPLSSVDPFGGVIITDWYTPPETPNERFKITAYILSRQLRADGLRISVFRERLTDGIWRTEKTAKDTAIKLENKVLERARQIRIASKKKY
jgi:hypothetical protein